MSFNEKEFAKYFTIGNKEGTHFRVTKKDCFKETLEEIFNIKIRCCDYEAVISGQGNEKEKIDAKYSSSLQSLLVFSQVSGDNKIKVQGKEYKEVYFEYKNKVFRFPSSVDVVLVGENDILFIESKLGEIIRDSSEEGKCVIGPSYFNKNGFMNIIKGEEEEQIDLLKAIGIDFQDLKEFYGEKDESKIKKKILECRTIDHNNKGWIKVNKVENNNYVYSYGIKQILAHTLGIYNFRNLDRDKIPTDCDNYLSNKTGYKIKFIELYNDLPNISEKGRNDYRKKIEEFKGHVKKTLGILKTDNCEFSLMTYQELWEENKDGYFKNNKIDKVIKYYHLDEKEDK